jgi:hypothetical protein
MPQWFNDKETQELLTKLLDRLCTLERMGGEALGSRLVFVPADTSLPILFAQDGKPFYPYEHLTAMDVKMAINAGLAGRLPA